MSSFDLTAIIDMGGGNDEFVIEFMNTFLENTPQTLDKFLNAWEEKDLEQVYMMAHKLKPAIDLARIDELKEVIRFVELEVREGRIQGIEERVLKIKHVLEQVFEEMKEEL